ncbi:MAG: hypothetical protein N3I86_09670 [Verrucomicrobiae bacterium]|nr:hypothetical protein [Verrucomicrobiae bacterium]
MARLIKIYDADWAKRKKRPAHRDEALWRVAPTVVAAAVSARLPVWLAAEACRRVARAGELPPPVERGFCRAEEE